LTSFFFNTPLSVLKTGIVSQANGSAFIEIGGTKVVASVYGPRPLYRVGGADGAQQINFGQSGGSQGATTSSGGNFDKEFSDEAIITCDWKYSSFADSIEEYGDENEREMGMAVAQALELAVIRKAYPKSSIDINILILQDDGACLSSAITCAGLALVHAGIQLYDLVPACTISISPSNELLLDPSKLEEKTQRGQIQLAMMATSQEVNLLKQGGELTPDQTLAALKMGTQGCQHVHSLIKKQLVELASKSS
jgi:exosome complex component MTR3